jgi:hypothetical protein
MDVEEPIFEKIAETPYDELTEETIQEWIDKSQEYHDRGETVTGLHGGECDSAEEACCEQCGEGHAIISAVQERESGNVTSMLSCTNSGCSGQFL